jgi:predicted NUDIX family NTP pyrophosphohydrolase
MTIRSAGILPYRYSSSDVLEVFLVHPGGPFWAKKDDKSWSVSKGIIEDGEDELKAAKREFAEETGIHIDGDFISLGEIKQPSKKIVVVWAVAANIDEKSIVSNTFNMEWPKGSGAFHDYPEVDRTAWFNLSIAKVKILKGQLGFIEKIASALNYKIENESIVNIQRSLF